MNNIYVEEYITDEERDRAYEFIRMLLKALPIKSDVKKGDVEGVNVMLTYHKTKMKNEANFYIDINDEFYTAKYIHSKLNHYKISITNKLTVFILNNKDAVEEFIMN
ncbi:MAG: hypothetical protein AB7V16_10860 [Vulcanibacillus sp.]